MKNCSILEWEIPWDKTFLHFVQQKYCISTENAIPISSLVSFCLEINKTEKTPDTLWPPFPPFFSPSLQRRSKLVKTTIEILFFPPKNKEIDIPLLLSWCIKNIPKENHPAFQNLMLTTERKGFLETRLAQKGSCLPCAYSHLHLQVLTSMIWLLQDFASPLCML